MDNKLEITVSQTVEAIVNEVASQLFDAIKYMMQGRRDEELEKKKKHLTSKFFLTMNIRHSYGILPQRKLNSTSKYNHKEIH